MTVSTCKPDDYLLAPDAETTTDHFLRGFHRLPRRGDPTCGCEAPPEVLRDMERNGWPDGTVLTTCLLEPGHAPAGRPAQHNGLLVQPGERPETPDLYSMFTWLATRRLGELVAR